MSDNPYSAPLTEIRTSTPTPTRGKRPLATRSQRFAGNLIDYVILIPLVIVTTSIVTYGVSFIYPTYLFEEKSLPVLQLIEQGIVLAAMSGVFLAINGYLLATRGQTIGKFLLKTQIVSDENELVPCLRIFLIRYLAFWCFGSIPGIGGLLSLGDSLAIFRGNQKCWHDDLAGTKVVMLQTPAHLRKMPDKIEISEES